MRHALSNSFVHSPSSAARLDKLHRLLANKNPCRELIAPIERRDVSIFAQRTAAEPFFETGMDRRADVRIRAAVELEPREFCVVMSTVAVIDPEVVLRNNRGEERGVPAKAVSIDRGRHVGAHASIEEPLGA